MSIGRFPRSLSHTGRLAVLGGVLLLLMAVGALLLWFRGPVNGPVEIPAGEMSAMQAGLSPFQIVERIADRADLADGPDRYANDLGVIALTEYGRLTGQARFSGVAAEVAQKRFRTLSVAPYPKELFVSLSYELVRDGRDRHRVAAYAVQSNAYRREVLRAPDGAISFYRDGLPPTEQADGSSVHLVKANAPILIDNGQQYAIRMACTARLTHDPALAREASDQIGLYQHALRDPTTGLWAHARGWFGNAQSLASTKWGRGQAWVLRGLVETRLCLPKDSADARKVEAVLTRYAADLLRYQDGAGFWHEIVDDPASYAETSATGMISYYLAKAHAAGILPDPRFARSATMAWQGLLRRKVSADGHVYGGVRDTPPSADRDHYRNRATPRDDPHAVAAVIMAANGQLLLRRSPSR